MRGPRAVAPPRHTAGWPSTSRATPARSTTPGAFISSTRPSIPSSASASNDIADVGPVSAPTGDDPRAAAGRSALDEALARPDVEPATLAELSTLPADTLEEVVAAFGA